jgi:hypothetical protein
MSVSRPILTTPSLISAAAADAIIADAETPNASFFIIFIEFLLLVVVYTLRY